jgi:hypothetical protein
MSAGWWVMNDGTDYPRLSWENTGGVPIPLPGVIPLAGSGTAEVPYIVSTVQEFALMSWYSGVLNKHVQMTGDLDLRGVTIYPIGDFGQFTGVFDGKGYAISNAVINQSSANCVGIFRSVGSGGQIRNLGVRNVNIAGRYYVGGLVGQTYGTVTSCYVTGSVRGGRNVGGLVGYSSSGTTISSCYVTGTVRGTANNVGGIVGNNGGLITSCYLVGSVTGGRNVGGLVGENNHGSLSLCYSTGAIAGNSGVGGVVGYNGEGSVTFCHYDGAVTGNNKVGGIVGEDHGGPVTSCYSTKD